MLELYEAYATYIEVMDLTEGMIRDVAREAMATTVWSSGTATRIDLARRSAAGSWKKRCANNPEISAAPTARPRRAGAHCARLGVT
jgi:lysyl-tRNA synthetase class 2